MTVTQISPRIIEQAQPIEVVRPRTELQWNDPHPLDGECLFLDGRAQIRGSVNVSASGAQEYLSIRVELPNGGHYLLALTLAAQANLADAIVNANTKWDEAAS